MAVEPSADPPKVETTEIEDPFLAAPPLDEECDSMESTNSNDGDLGSSNPETSHPSYPVMYPAYYSPFFPFPFPIWSGCSAEPAKRGTHELVKPTAVHSTAPINVDELVGMSKLSLGDSIGPSAPSSLSLKLLAGSSRQSAFHASPPSGSSNSNGNVIHAV